MMQSYPNLKTPFKNTIWYVQDTRAERTYLWVGGCNAVAITTHILSWLSIIMALQIPSANSYYWFTVCIFLTKFSHSSRSYAVSKWVITVISCSNYHYNHNHKYWKVADTIITSEHVYHSFKEMLLLRSLSYTSVYAGGTYLYDS